MNLENIIGTFEKKVESIPWWIKLLNYPEYQRAKTAVRKSKSLMKNYEKSERWFLEIGNQYNEIYSSVKSITNNTYDLYDKVKTIPIIGNIATYAVKGAVNRNLNKVNNIGTSLGIGTKTKKKVRYNIPKKETVNRGIDESYELGLKLLTSYAAMETGVNEEIYWNKLCKTGTKFDSNKSLMKYITEKLNSFEKIYKEIFTPQTKLGE